MRMQNAKIILVGLGIGAAVALTPASASAQPGCTASGLSATLGGVSSATGAWLDAHPDADKVITEAGATGDEESIRQYFVAHQDQWSELQGIAAPLRNLRQSCSVQVAPAQIAKLFDAMAS